MTNDKCLVTLADNASSEGPSSSVRCNCARSHLDVVPGSRGPSRSEHFHQRSSTASLAWFDCWKRSGSGGGHVSGSSAKSLGRSVHSGDLERGHGGSHTGKPAGMAQLLWPLLHGSGSCFCLHCVRLPHCPDRWAGTGSNNGSERCHRQPVPQCSGLPLFFNLLS